MIWGGGVYVCLVCVGCVCVFCLCIFVVCMCFFYISDVVFDNKE